MNIKDLQSPDLIKEERLRQEELREMSAALSEQRQKKLYSVAQETAKQEYFANIDFYIVAVWSFSREFAYGVQPEDFFFVRRSCPTPAYNQNVFKYHHQTGTLEFLWSIPKKARYYQLYHNRMRYLADPVLKARTAFVVSMETGKLLEWVKKENGDLPDAVINLNKHATA